MEEDGGHCLLRTLREVQETGSSGLSQELPYNLLSCVPAFILQLRHSMRMCGSPFGDVRVGVLSEDASELVEGSVWPEGSAPP